VVAMSRTRRWSATALLGAVAGLILLVPAQPDGRTAGLHRGSFDAIVVAGHAVTAQAGIGQSRPVQVAASTPSAVVAFLLTMLLLAGASRRPRRGRVRRTTAPIRAPPGPHAALS